MKKKEWKRTKEDERGNMKTRKKIEKMKKKSKLKMNKKESN